MQAKINDVNSFKPYTIEISVETADDHASLLALFGLDSSVSQVVADAEGDRHREPLRKLFNVLYTLVCRRHG